MRSLPTGWPASSAAVQKVPKVYLRLVGSSWPPASVVDGESLPAGTTVTGDCSINWDLDAPLLPGQVNASPKLMVADATCTIPQPKGGLLAPWRAGAEALPSTGQCELIASYDGYAGSTAFLLGRFVLEPISGRLSDPFLTVRMIQDLMRLRRDHTIPGQDPGIGVWVDSSRIVQYAAESCGFAFTKTGSFPSNAYYAYFPRHTDQLEAMQRVVSANLGAMFLSMDGTTIKVLDPDYLNGEGALVETLDVMGQLEDLVWSQDPNATVDRVEATWTPPAIDASPLGPVPFNTNAVWYAPKGFGLAPGQNLSFDFDPGSYIEPFAFAASPPVFNFQIMVNDTTDGAGASSFLSGAIVQRSSGWWSVSITNTTGSGKYFSLPYDAVGTVDRGWGVPKGSPSFIPGKIERATDSDNGRLLEWGATSDAASNTLSFPLSNIVQEVSWATDIFNRIVTRIATPMFVVDNVRVLPNLGRELGDLCRVQSPEVGLDKRALVTGIQLDITSSDVVQTLSLAMLPLQPDD